MARRNDIQYVRYYTFGAAAQKLDTQERKATLPKYKPEKRIPVPVDPVSILGSAVAIVLAVLMLVGLIQVHYTNYQVKMAEAEVITQERIHERLSEEYAASYDLDEVRVAAESMGMIPAEQALRVSVPVETPVQEPVQVSWWDSLLASLHQLFA